MTTDEALRVAAEALAESVLVVGMGDAGETAASRVADRDVPATDAVAEPDAVVLAVDAPDLDTATPTAATDPDVPVSVAVVTLPSSPGDGEREALAALAADLDAVVLASTDAAGDGAARDLADADGEGAVDDLADAVATFVSVVRDSGFVNVDLADARTVLEPVAFASLGVGESERGRPSDAVDAALASLPDGLETDAAGGVLVDLLGGPAMSVEDVSDAVSAVRDRVGPDAHVIWGGAVDESLGDGVVVRLVLAGVDVARTALGDGCPRCGGSLSEYSLGSRSTLSCDACGYAGVSVRLRE